MTIQSVKSTKVRSNEGKKTEGGAGGGRGCKKKHNNWFFFFFSVQKWTFGSRGPAKVFLVSFCFPLLSLAVVPNRRTSNRFRMALCAVYYRGWFVRFELSRYDLCSGSCQFSFAPNLPPARKSRKLSFVVKDKRFI